MKYSSLVWSLALAIALATGCERQEPSDQDPEVFDPQIDAVGGIIGVQPDESLLADQTQLSRSVERTMPAKAVADRTALSGGTPVDQVRQAVAQATEQAQAGDIEPTLALLVDEQAEVMRPVLELQQQFRDKTAEFQQLVQDYLGVTNVAEQMPPLVAAAIQQKQKGVASDLQAMLPDETAWQMDGENVVISLPEGLAITFAPVDSQYKASLPEQMIATMPTAGNLLTAMNAFLDRMIAGIGDGTITADNLQAQAASIAQETVDPVIQQAQGAAPGDQTPMGEAPPEREEIPMGGMPGDPPGMPGAPQRRGPGGTLGRMVNPLQGAEDAGN